MSHAILLNPVISTGCLLLICQEVRGEVKFLKVGQEVKKTPNY